MSKNLIWIVDIETTGFFNKGGLIVEIGIASLDLDTWEIKEVMDLVVKEPWFDVSHTKSPFWWIFSNSSLTPDDVIQAQSLEEVLPKIQSCIDLFPLGITAYNKAFDFTFLRDRGITIAKELPCPMKVATPVLQLPSTGYGDYKRPKVEEAWDHLVGTPYVEAHRWLDDAIHEARIVYELYKKWVFEV